MNNKKTSFPWENRNITEQLAKSYALIKAKGHFVFTQIFDVKTEQADKNRPLDNALVSIKDLINVAGYKTRAGSKFLEATDIATQDAVAVQKLRAAGATLLGHTNMTELAFSGLGLNPHYGTPETPLYKGCIAGGSSSGGAVSVALGIVDIALGTDTGGSLRIPAAFCGVTGFKPSQNSVSREGCLPLSFSLDSIGPIAHNVSECECAWQVLSDVKTSSSVAKQAKLVIPTNFGFDNLDIEVKNAFQAMKLQLMQTEGITIEEKHLSFLDDYKTLPIWHFAAFEAKHYYEERFNFQWEQLDPRVASRLKRADHLQDGDFKATNVKREALIHRYAEEENNDILLLPTVAILPPRLSTIESNDDYDRINNLCLRNTSLANVLDGCSISMPYQHQGNHIGVMLIAANGDDTTLLSIAKKLELSFK